MTHTLHRYPKQYRGRHRVTYTYDGPADFMAPARSMYRGLRRSGVQSVAARYAVIGVYDEHAHVELDHYAEWTVA